MVFDFSNGFLYTGLSPSVLLKRRKPMRRFTASSLGFLACFSGIYLGVALLAVDAGSLSGAYIALGISASIGYFSEKVLTFLGALPNISS